MLKRKSFLDCSSDEEDDVQIQPKYQIVVLGPRKVGKTSFIQRIQSDQFTLQYVPTRGIQIHTNISLGDLFVDMWEIPPDTIDQYTHLSTLTADVIILMFNSDIEDSLHNGIQVWSSLYAKIYTNKNPEMWLVHTGDAHPQTTVCHPNRIFKVNNMSKEGLLDLIYDIRCKLLHKY